MFVLSLLIAVNYMFLVQGKCPEIVSRKDWGSACSLPKEILTIPVSKVIFHQTESHECTNRNTCIRILKYIQKYHAIEMDLGDIAFNFVIGGDGNIYEGRGWNTSGAYTYEHTREFISVAFVGNYAKKDPKPEMLTQAENLIECGVIKGYISPNYGVYGIRDVTCSLGPGKHFYNTLKTIWPHWHALGELEKKCQLT